MLVVLGIIGLIAMASIPAFTNYTRQVRLKTTTRSVAALLSLAREQAISLRKERTVVIDPERREVAIEETLDDPEPRVVKLPTSVSVDLEIGGQQPEGGEPALRVAFQPNGGLSGRSVSFVLSSEGRTQSVTVTSATGSIAIH